MPGARRKWIDSLNAVVNAYPTPTAAMIGKIVGRRPDQASRDLRDMVKEGLVVEVPAPEGAEPGASKADMRKFYMITPKGYDIIEMSTHSLETTAAMWRRMADRQAKVLMKATMQIGGHQ